MRLRWTNYHACIGISFGVISKRCAFAATSVRRPCGSRRLALQIRLAFSQADGFSGAPCPNASCAGPYNSQDIRAFLSPHTLGGHDPNLFTDMQPAVKRTLEAIDRRETILIYGDYDVDGQVSTALLVSALRTLGAEVRYFTPSRLSDGYGLSVPVLQRVVGAARLVITVDCGITANEAVAWAQASGIDCIVTDHHEPGEELPPAVACVNPKRSDCQYPEKGPRRMRRRIEVCPGVVAGGRSRF